MLILFSFLIFSASLGGGLLPLLIHSSKERELKAFVALGAGILLGMSFLHLLPHASELCPQTFGFYFLVGFLILLLLERFMVVHACEEGDCHYHRVGITAVSGLAVHGVIEGFALGSSQIVTSLGPLVLVAILMHKGPSTFALSSILKLAGKSHKQIILYALFVSVSGPLGIWTAFELFRSTTLNETAGALIAITAGTFVYIGACDLLPEVHRQGRGRTLRLVAFLVGIALSGVTGLWLDH